MQRSKANSRSNDPFKRLYESNRNPVTSKFEPSESVKALFINYPGSLRSTKMDFKETKKSTPISPVHKKSIQSINLKGGGFGISGANQVADDNK